jgi:hypothetical protein
MRTQRRKFLKSGAALAAGMAMPCDNADAQVIAAASEAPRPRGTNATLPRVRLGKHEVSRLIIGGNPFYGYSHFNRLFSTHMTEWATPERVCETLTECERNGINTWQFSHSERPLADLQRHREQGGKLQWILLSHRDIEDDHSLIGKVAKQQPIGIVHHGGSAERKRRAGELGKVRDFLKSVRDSGLQVGLSCHDPELLELVEDQNWDIDFYMTAFYYLTRTPEDFEKLLGQRPLGEVYLPEDPPRMCRAIRQTTKTCLAYKVLAAGRLTDNPKQIDQAFRFAYDNIKPQDCLIIGMYPRYTNQVQENADLVRAIVSKS